MLSRKLVHLLKQRHVHYGLSKHPASYTALMTAEAAHVPGKMMAKTVILRIEGELRMFVMPAGETVDMEALRDIFGTEDVRLAHEDEFAWRFEDCEPGAEPPFGNLYDMPVYVSEKLTEDDEIVFNAGDHVRMMKMKYADYASLVHPCVMNWNL